MSDEIKMNKGEKELLENVPEILRRMQMQSTSLSRSMLSGRLGTQFSGERDLYQTFGYILNPLVDDYKNLFDRQGLAGRAVRKFADDTFNAPAVLVDGDVRSDNTEEKSTPFIDAWNTLEKRISPWSMMRQADIMCGFSRYSIIFFGTPATSFADPVGKVTPDAVFYLQAFHEGTAGIGGYINDVKSPSFGLPQSYSVDFSGDTGEVIQLPGGNQVHHTRVIHIAEEKLGSRVFGTPRLQNIINRLFDLEKTVGGGAEAAWLAVYQGMLFLARDGAQLPAEGTAEADALDETINKFMHRIQRYAALEGVDVQNLGVSTVDIKGIFEVLSDDLCGSLGIPKRIFFGSERGELASSQDKREWNGVIDSRRTNHAEPNIARPFINWMIQHGVIPPPQSGDFDIEWREVYPMTKAEKADYSKVLADGAATVSGGNAGDVYRENEWRVANDLPPLTDEELKEMQEEADKEKEEGLALEKAKALAGEKDDGEDPESEDSQEKDNPFQNSLTLNKVKQQGGKGSGNFGHSGLPGKHGGSRPKGAGGGESVVVYQGRPKKDDTLENKEGLIWASTAREAAETHARIEDVYYPYREEGKRHEKIYHGEIRKVKLTYENPLVVDHATTLWDRDKEAKVIKDAKNSGYDAVIFEYKFGKKDYVVWDKSQATIESVEKNSLHLQGGKGSGNFGHSGLPGKHGGSRPKGAGGSVESQVKSHPKYSEDLYNTLKESGKDDREILDILNDIEGTHKEIQENMPVGDDADLIVSEMAEQFNYDKKKLRFSATLADPVKVGNRVFTPDADFYPPTGEITFYAAGRHSEKVLRGIAAHEMTHAKFENYQKARVAGEKWAVDITNDFFSGGDLTSKLISSDGVTPYSQVYWMDSFTPGFGLDSGKIGRAMNETLAEISRVDALGLDVTVSPIWRGLHRRVIDGG
jgi:hypothetical protein